MLNTCFQLKWIERTIYTLNKLFLCMQVEDLTLKSQLLEAELERTTRQLKEAIQLAMEEADKNKAAKEVIKSLSRQVREKRWLNKCVFV